MSPEDALRKAIAAAGTQVKLAERVSELCGKKVTQGHVSVWLRRSGCPADRVMAVCVAAGHVVSPEDLRPDVFLAPGELPAETRDCDPAAAESPV